MKIFKLAGTIPVLALVFSASVAGAATLGTPSPSPTTTSFVFPSTNADNFSAGANWVELVSTGPGSVELKFVNENTFGPGAFFEYRVDDAAATSITPHYLLKDFVGDDSLYPFFFVGPSSERTETIAASSFVDVRHAFGPEQDVHFDWTRFETAAPIPLPAAGWLLLTAFGGLGLATRRRRKAA